MYALEPSLVQNSAEVTQHLRDCEACLSTLDEMRSFDKSLSDPDAWIGLVEENDQAPSGFHELREFALRMAAEDAEAEHLLSDFDDASPAWFAWSDIPSMPEFRTAGVVRVLCQRAHSMCEVEPRYALALADAASKIAGLLPDANYPANAIHELRGHAWKEHANALWFLGKLPEALMTLDSAETEYEKLSHTGIGIAAVAYIRACVLYEQDKFDDAAILAQRSAAIADHLGDAERGRNARFLQGHVLYDKHAYRESIAVFEEIRRRIDSIADWSWLARTSQALGIAHIELGNLEDAERYLEEALSLFQSHRIDTQVTRTRWALGRRMFFSGHATEAAARLKRCFAEFTALGMLTDAGLVTIDLAEILSSVGQIREVTRLLADTVVKFTQAGKLTSALTAFAYLKEAAESAPLTKELLAYTRRFIIRADRQPDLLFLPPPPTG